MHRDLKGAEGVPLPRGLYLTMQGLTEALFAAFLLQPVERNIEARALASSASFYHPQCTQPTENVNITI
jgi:hypothetical protein